MSKVKENLNLVFPGGAVGGVGNRVVLNTVFKLTAFQFQVEVEATDAWSFTLRTKFYHPLSGSARHGVLKDSNGELWLMQEGLGEYLEFPPRILVNYTKAKSMWIEMAQNIKSLYM